MTTLEGFFMGRRPEYKEPKTEEALKNEAEALIHTGILTPKQMAAYLSSYSRHGVHFDEKKVKNRIADICSLSNKLITPDDFKAKTGRHPYQLKPEWHGLLFALMDTDYFDNRKNNRLLNTRDSLHRDLIVNIENYLNLADKKIIENYPGYLIAKVESLSSEVIAFQMQTIVRDIMTSDDTIRFKLLRRTYDTLNQLILDNQRDISKHWAHKTINSINLDQAEHNEFMATLLSANNLPRFMATLLAFKVKGNAYTNTDDIEHLIYQNMYNTEQPTDHISLGDLKDYEIFEHDLNKTLEHKKSLNDDFYADFIIKIFRVIDLSDPIELQLGLRIYKLLSRCYGITSLQLKQNEELANKFFETSMKKDLSDLLKDLLSNGPLQSPTLLELDRLQKQAPIRKNRDKMDNNLEN